MMMAELSILQDYPSVSTLTALLHSIAAMPWEKYTGKAAQGA